MASRPTFAFLVVFVVPRLPFVVNCQNFPNDFAQTFWRQRNALKLKWRNVYFSLLPAFLHIFLCQNSTCLGALCTFVVRTHCARHINLSYHYIYGRIYSLESNGIECIQTYWLEQHEMKMASSSMAKKLKENHAIQLYGVENNWKYWMESEIIDYTFFCFDGVVYMGVSGGEWVAGCLHLLDSQWIASSSSRRFHSHSQKTFRRWYINWKMYFEFIYFIN